MSDDGISTVISYFTSWGEKVKPTIESMKADFLEIKECVLPNSDSNSFIQDTTNLAKKHVFDNIYEGASYLKNGVNSLVHNFSATSPDETSGKYFWDKKKAMLLQIQSSNDTYLHNYSEDEDYLNWDKNTKLSLHDDSVEELLQNDIVKTKHESLVPGKIDDETFWKHYFYKIHLVEQEENRRQALLQRAATTLKEDLAWDGNEDDWEFTSIPSPSSHTSTPEIVSREDGQIEQEKREEEVKIISSITEVAKEK